MQVILQDTLNRLLFTRGPTGVARELVKALPWYWFFLLARPGVANPRFTMNRSLDERFIRRPSPTLLFFVVVYTLLLAYRMAGGFEHLHHLY